MAAESIRGTEAQGATFVELFFDLVFVFAVTQVTAVLAHDLTLGGVVRAGIIFWLVWWAWTQYTWSLNQADTEHVQVRLFALFATGVAFVMAVSVPFIEEPYGWLFPVSYIVLRVAGIGIQLRMAEEEWASRGPVMIWAVMSALGLLAVLAAAILSPQQRYIALAIAALLDVIAALRAGSTGDWKLFVPHFTERHGLFVIIALGESLIAAGVAGSSQTLDRGVLAVTLLAVIATCGLWWTYFGWAKDALEEKFAEIEHDVGNFARDVYSFGHFPVIAGVIGFAVATEETIAHPSDVLPVEGIIALVGGIVLFIGGVYVALLRSRAHAPAVRPVGLTLLVVGAPLMLLIPAWLSMTGVVVIVLGIAVLERRAVGSVAVSAP